MNKIVSETTGVNLSGKVAVLRKSVLKPEYQEKDRRILCQGGFGCSPTAMGRAVSGVSLLDGEEARWNRSDFEGIAEDQTIPASIKL